MAQIHGTCSHDCPDSCGWLIDVNDGKATRIAGNPAHPYSQGELCPKVNRLLDRVYASDRILHPLMRTGPKGAGAFRTCTWDEALDRIGTEVRRIVDEHGGEALYGWSSAGTQGSIQMDGLDSVVLSHLGASRLTGSLCGNTAKDGFSVTYGSGLSKDPLACVHSDMVVLWGTNTRLTNRHLWPFITQAREAGAKLWVIDPIDTVTAQQADQTLRPRPGTDPAIMLGVAEFIFANGFVDQDYVDRHVHGLDSLRALSAAWPLDRVAAVTGCAEADIRQFAAEYASTPNTLIRTLIGAEHTARGATFFRLLGALPLLTGSWRHRGGGLSRSVGSWFSPLADTSVFERPWPTRGLNMIHLGRHLTDPAVGIFGLFSWNGNPAASLPNASAVRRGLAREELFTVVGEQFMTDTARFADVILPATTQIEQVDVVEAWGHLYLGWNEPAIAPRGEAVSNTEMWRRIGAACGVVDSSLELTDRELLDTIYGRTTTERLQQVGMEAIDPNHAAQFCYANGGFDTPTGKAEIRYAGTRPEVPKEISWDPPEPLGSFQLLTPKHHPRFLNSTYSLHHGPREGEAFAEFTTVDAARLGVAAGAQVRVHNERGSMVLEARVADRLPAGVIAIPFGWWGEQCANLLTSDEPTDWGGGVAYHDTWVEVEVAPV